MIGRLVGLLDDVSRSTQTLRTLPVRSSGSVLDDIATKLDNVADAFHDAARAGAGKEFDHLFLDTFDLSTDARGINSTIAVHTGPLTEEKIILRTIRPFNEADAETGVRMLADDIDDLVVRARPHAQRLDELAPPSTLDELGTEMQTGLDNNVRHPHGTTRDALEREVSFIEPYDEISGIGGSEFGGHEFGGLTLDLTKVGEYGGLWP